MGTALACKVKHRVKNAIAEGGDRTDPVWELALSTAGLWGGSAWSESFKPWARRGTEQRQGGHGLQGGRPEVAVTV